MNCNLQPIWDTILDIWKECYAICERHNLRIWVTAGTALGAIRHKGFIPWDDDFDVLMPRMDYNLFMKYASSELPSYMKWHSIENDSSYRLMFGKVKDERQEILERVKAQSRLDLNEGIFIDFFPLDGLPSTKLGCFLWNVQRSAIRRLKLFGDDQIRFQKWISQRDFEKSKNVGWCLSDSRFPRFILKKEWFEKTELVDFEDIKVPVPVGVHYHLTNIYGDYMKLPPEQERKPSHQIIQRKS